MKTFWIGLALVIWIGGSSFVYVCHIRDHCSGENMPEESETQREARAIEPASETATEPVAPSVAEDASPEVTINERPTYIVTFEVYITQVDGANFDADYLEDLLFAIENERVASIRIEGHSDISGASALNERLSRDRASAVKAFLVARGISEALIESAGVGSDQPRSSNATGQGRSENRRVEIKTTYQK